MIKKLLQSALIGLVCAALILFVAPRFMGNSLLPLTNEVMSFKQAVRLAAPAVVNVYNQSFVSENNLDAGDVITSELGSGVIMSADGLVVTNKHVIQMADQVIILLQDGRAYEATLVGVDSLTDLAVLRIYGENLPTILQNPKRLVHVGDIALAIGNPYNLGQSVSQGIISGTGRNAIGETVGRQNFIQTDASINKGNSGGALINSLGELIGINTLTIGKNEVETAEGLGFAIPISVVNDVVQRILRDGRVIRGYLGVSTNILYSNGQERDYGEGIMIDALKPNGPAQKAGLKENDVILKYGEQAIGSPSQLMDLISNTRPNTTVPLLILRGDKQLTIPVTIEEYPEEDTRSEP
ncbi:outer membrane-stress sensor serine endopeptidase DegS [Actinobacillus porcinus]|uniref:Periplasmic serine protease DegS n=1 Tax=Actinobacillus porcinus TaxID=51048 RepID=A0ABY6TKJ1_9PAST|nr:outer membrane-stress sensor serine endopeptidase DegS [Actinobacillus porcinus]MDD7544954.1 outer membrane-stress sensor serine endopeptidase DegS [Actinobacillus porcinus]MDY5849058.1 outer membrane-stress sensor serine endopeptidase DegS [Actinobacillus porcinus]MDY6215966.1 outer membrane-stress sensor serine endopeptidase DegS [Actinobacillus porcinus]VFY93014.1 periplasmic serine protease DegS [Actinobacillus porcinus]VTU07662.1 periplasmic serine protease DegS [Actinobacillus porcinu